MKGKIVSLFVLMFLFTVQVVAQGTIRGEVKDVNSGEGIFGVLVKIDGVGKAKTDFEGAFSVKTTAGKHVVTFSNVTEGYIDQDREVEVIDGQVTVVSLTLSKDKSVQTIGDVTVVGTKTTGGPTTIAATDKKRMDENGSTDGLPKEQITNTGVPTAAEAVQMIPAASVQDGKNVYIRGLGDRYSKTILNGMDIPGLDPDRNSVQLDVFPAVLIDNITVYKTFTPNLVGDFTGGLVDITTKDFPSKKSIYVKGSLGYNTFASFNPNFLTYQGGKFDFLGFDDGSRKLPVNPLVKIPNPVEGKTLTSDMTRAFGKTMATEPGFSFLNQNYAFALGNQYSLGKEKKNTYGFNFVLNYRNTNTFYKDAQYNEFRRSTDSTETRLLRDRSSNGQVAENDVMWTALIGQSYKFKRNKISLNVFHTQNGISSAANLTQINSESNPAILVKHSAQYTQRSISNANLQGLHYLNEKRSWKMNWKLSPTYSRITDPDMRSTVLEQTENLDANSLPIYELNQAVGAEVRRTFRDLKEYNIGAKLDFNYSFVQWDSLKSEISFGVLNTYKQRSFDVDEYTFNVKGDVAIDGDPNWFFRDENIWTPETNRGVYAVGQKEKANIYEATQNTAAIYLMHELPITERFNATYGARVEQNKNFYTGQSNNAEFDTTAPRYDNELVLDALNVLPSLNLVYKIRKDKDSTHSERNSNIRAAYATTLARPSFREISISQIYDPIQGRRYLGNIDLKQTVIHNADLRYEHFFGRTELISVSAFYKKFINPIEVVANVAAPNELKPVNAGQADIYGAEFELRKAIGFKNNDKSSLVAGLNVTYILSRINMNDVQTIIGGDTLTEKQVRQNNAREGEKIGDYRQMYGQSPYIINSYITFRNEPMGLMFNMSYNVQGKRLAVIGVGSLPDVYEQPFHSLNFKVSKQFGKIHEELKESSPRWTASLRGQNLLNNAKRRFYESYNADSQIYDYLNQGMTFSFSLTYQIR